MNNKHVERIREHSDNIRSAVWGISLLFTLIFSLSSATTLGRTVLLAIVSLINYTKNLKHHETQYCSEVRHRNGIKNATQDC
jgi:hypothetical protein